LKRTDHLEAPSLCALQGVRSATVIADKDRARRVLTRADFDELSITSPSVAIRLLAAIARELSGRLKAANRTIHELDL